MAPRAAARLESLGFEEVLEYKAGKQDWFGSGLPSEGRLASGPTIASVLHADVPRFALRDSARMIVDTLRDRGWERGAVVDRQGVLLGRVRANLESPPAGATAEDVMESGPGTYRPNVGLDELLQRLVDRGLDAAFVTDPDGHLLGLVRRRDIAYAIEERRKKAS